MLHSFSSAEYGQPGPKDVLSRHNIYLCRVGLAEYQLGPELFPHPRFLHPTPCYHSLCDMSSDIMFVSDAYIGSPHPRQRRPFFIPYHIHHPFTKQVHYTLHRRTSPPSFPSAAQLKLQQSLSVRNSSIEPPLPFLPAPFFHHAAPHPPRPPRLPAHSHARHCPVQTCARAWFNVRKRRS